MKLARRTPHAALLLLMVAASCSGTGAHRGGERIRDSNLGPARATLFRTQAEAEASLARFDRKHPQCQLWTNWQKICSRTGAGGATYCRSDPEHPARPSAPFCVVGAIHPLGPLHMNDGDSPRVRASRNRYCVKFGTALVDPESPSKLPTCQSYREDRPFNGTSPASVDHPLCRHWVARPPLLSGTASLLYCDEWAPNDACPSIVGVIRPPGLANGIIVFNSPIPTSVPVWGTYCAPRGTTP